MSYNLKKVLPICTFTLEKEIFTHIAPTLNNSGEFCLLQYIGSSGKEGCANDIKHLCSAALVKDGRSVKKYLNNLCKLKYIELVDGRYFICIRYLREIILNCKKDELLVPVEKKLQELLEEYDNFIESFRNSYMTEEAKNQANKMLQEYQAALEERDSIYDAFHEAEELLNSGKLEQLLEQQKEGFQKLSEYFPWIYSSLHEDRQCFLDDPNFVFLEKKPEVLEYFHEVDQESYKALERLDRAAMTHFQVQDPEGFAANFPDYVFNPEMMKAAAEARDKEIQRLKDKTHQIMIESHKRFAPPNEQEEKASLQELEQQDDVAFEQTVDQVNQERNQTFQSDMDYVEDDDFQPEMDQNGNQYFQPQMNQGGNQHFQPQMNQGGNQYFQPQMNQGGNQYFQPQMNQGGNQYFQPQVNQGGNQYFQPQMNQGGNQYFHPQMNQGGNQYFQPQMNQGGNQYFHPQMNQGGNQYFHPQMNQGGNQYFHPQMNQGGNQYFHPQMNQGGNQYFQDDLEEIYLAQIDKEIEEANKGQLILDQIQFQKDLREAQQEASRKARIAQEQEKARQAQIAQEQEEANQAQIAQEQEEANQAQIAQEQEEANQAQIAQEQEEANQAQIAQEQEEANQAQTAQEQEAARQAQIAQEQERSRQAQIAQEQERARQAQIAQEQEAARQAQIAQEQEAARQAQIAQEQEAARQAQLLQDPSRKSKFLEQQAERERQAEFLRQQESARNARLERECQERSAAKGRLLMQKYAAKFQEAQENSQVQEAQENSQVQEVQENSQDQEYLESDQSQHIRQEADKIFMNVASNIQTKLENKYEDIKADFLKEFEETKTAFHVFLTRTDNPKNYDDIHIATNEVEALLHRFFVLKKNEIDRFVVTLNKYVENNKDTHVNVIAAQIRNNFKAITSSDEEVFALYRDLSSQLYNIVLDLTPDIRTSTAEDERILKEKFKAYRDKVRAVVNESSNKNEDDEDLDDDLDEDQEEDLDEDQEEEEDQDEDQEDLDDSDNSNVTSTQEKDFVKTDTSIDSKNSASNVENEKSDNASEQNTQNTTSQQTSKYPIDTRPAIDLEKLAKEQAEYEEDPLPPLTEDERAELKLQEHYETTARNIFKAKLAQRAKDLKEGRYIQNKFYHEACSMDEMGRALNLPTEKSLYKPIKYHSPFEPVQFSDEYINKIRQICIDANKRRIVGPIPLSTLQRQLLAFAKVLYTMPSQDRCVAMEVIPKEHQQEVVMLIRAWNLATMPRPLRDYQIDYLETDFRNLVDFQIDIHDYHQLLAEKKKREDKKKQEAEEARLKKLEEERKKREAAEAAAELERIKQEEEAFQRESGGYVFNPDSVGQDFIKYIKDGYEREQNERKLMHQQAEQKRRSEEQARAIANNVRQVQLRNEFFGTNELRRKEMEKYGYVAENNQQNNQAPNAQMMDQGNQDPRIQQMNQGNQDPRIQQMNQGNQDPRIQQMNQGNRDPRIQ